MPKPTLLQTILGKPSQTYRHPAEREYHSTKDELLRIAGATKALPGHLSCSESGFDSSTSPGNSDSEQHQPSRTVATTAASALPRPPAISAVLSDGASCESTSQSGQKSLGRNAARKRSLIHSIASSSSYASFKNVEADRAASYTQPPGTSSTRRSSSVNTSARQSRSSRTFTPSSRGNEGDAEDSTDDDDDNGTDVFYTPRESFVSSPRISRISAAAAMLEPQALASALLPLHSKASPSPLAGPDGTDSNPVSRTPSGSSISSVASSTSGGDDGPSPFSSPTQTASTRLTTPANSDRGVQHREDTVEAITIASSSRARPSSSGGKSAASTTSTRSSSSTVRKRSREEVQKLTYTDEDWAQDVRWLTPPKMPAASSGTSSSSRRRPLIIAPDFQLPPPLELGPPSTYVQPSTRRPGGGARSKGDRRSKRSRNSRGRMSALWEEDESEECSTGLSSTEPSRATTPILETPPHSLPPSPLAKATTLPPDLLDEGTPSESTHESTPDARLQKYARGQRRSLSTTAAFFRPSASSSATLPTHPLPTPFSASSSTSNGGYTGLTLPHAGYSNAKGKTSAEGHVDLVRAGLAQSSMCTIEVIRGVAATISNGTSPLPSAKTRKKSFSLSLGRSFSLSLKPKRRESATPVHLQGSLPLPVAFTAHVSPPTYVPESHVLVQVHAVGLDTLDSLIVHEKSGMNGGAGMGVGKGIGGGKAGFIPGRSFVGKVVECGWAVSPEVCKRGEWVVGLLDVRKLWSFRPDTLLDVEHQLIGLISQCGALAEFIVVERHRVHRAPQPRVRTASLFPARRRPHIRSSSLPANAQALPYASSPLAPAPLTVEELALLPLCGVPAHRAIRTFVDVLAPPISRAAREGTKSDVRALVLQGHDGAGALAVQMLGRRGVRICVQVPDSAVDDPQEDARKLSVEVVRSSPSPSPSKNKGKGRAGVLGRREQVEARLRDWGAEDICIGEPLDVLRRLAEEGQSFDAVLDTVGGAAIWEASQRLLTTDWTDTAARSSLSLASRSELKLNGGPPSSPHEAASSAEHHGSPDPSHHKPSKLKGKLVSHAQFTTLVGDTPHRAIPTAQDNLRSGLRSLRRSMSTSSSPSKASPASLGRSAGVATKSKRIVGYAWVSVAADVDFEGEDVRDSLGAVVRMAEDGWLRPWVGGGGSGGGGSGTGNGHVVVSASEEGKVVPFERAPEVFRRGVVGPLGVLADGGTCAVKIVE
ncbi:hypothetical protein BD414DRAFT_529595 [Trametes punicea]|nr:hypothetical protein BD414DRAFT_529595 [Trametes punicea]